MVSAGVVLAVKLVTAATTLLVVLSPSIALRRVVRNKDVGGVSVLPILLLMTSSHLWMMYGAVADLIFPVFSLFLLGEVLAATYFAIYWRFAPDRHAFILRRLTVVLAILTVATVYAILGALGHTNQSHHGVVSTLGLMADFALVALYAAPMERVALVLKNKSAQYIQLPMVIAGTLNNLAWLSYGAVTSNWFIIGPNFLFVSIHVFQLGLCIIYRKRTAPIVAVQDAAGLAIAIDIVEQSDAAKPDAAAYVPYAIASPQVVAVEKQQRV